MIRIDPELIDRAQHGDQNAAVMICEQMEPITRTVARIIPQWWKDDAMQAGRLGTLIALSKFDQSRSDDFSTFAGQYIKNEIYALYNQCVNACGVPKKIMAEYMLIKRTKPEVTVLSNGMKVHDLERIMQAVKLEAAI